MVETKSKTPKAQRSLIRWCKRRWLDLLITLGGMLVVLLATIYLHFLAPASWTKHDKVVMIPAGKSFHDIARILEENGIIRDRRSFYLLARIEGAVSKVKAGEYEVHTPMIPSEVLSKLVRGEVIQYPVTIPEGYNIYQIGEISGASQSVLQENLFGESKRSSPHCLSWGWRGIALEGYLFPDTYNFPKGFGEEQVIRQMVARFKTVFGSLAKRAEKMGLSQRDVVILASMIEKEAMDDQERRLIAAVFHNRLNRGMALQSDPTAIYGFKRGKRRMEKSLGRICQEEPPIIPTSSVACPKGPIANPGLKSLQAVLYPADVNYIYFVSKNDGTHYFSEHPRRT